MRCEILEKDKIICLYLSKSESSDTELTSRLSEYCSEQSKAGFKIAIIRSGVEDKIYNLQAGTQ